MSKWRKIKENREEKEALEEQEEHQRPKNRNRSDNCSTEIAIAGSNNIPSLAISPSFCARHSRALGNDVQQLLFLHDTLTPILLPFLNRFLSP